MPERLAATSSRGSAAGAFASLAAGVGEVQVLDHDGAGPMLAGRGQDARDCGPQPPVPSASGQARQWQGDGERDADLVAIRVQHRHREVPGVHVHRNDGALPGPRQRHRRGWRRLPRCVDVPAPACRVQGDVIADGPGRGLRGNIAAPVGKLDRAREPVTPAGPVAQARQRSRELDLQPVLIRVPADRLVAPGLILLPVGGKEQPGRGPSLTPPGRSQTGIGEIVPLAQQGFPAPAYAHLPGV